MIRRTAIVALMTVAIASCSWPMAGQGPDRRGWSRFDTVINPTNVDLLGVHWSAPGNVLGLVGDGTTVVTTDPLRIRALDQTTGTERWSAAEFPSTVAIDGPNLVTATSGSVCTARTRALATGSVTKTVTFGGIPDLTGGITHCYPGSMTPVGGVRLLTESDDGFGQRAGCDQIAWRTATDVVALDANLEVRWQYDLPTGSGCGAIDTTVLNAPGFTGVASDGTRVYTTRTNQVVALPLTCPAVCVPAWTRTFAAHFVEAPIVLTDGDLVVRDVGGKVFVLDATDGATKWTATTPWGGLAANATTLFVSGNDRVVRAFPAAGCGATTCSPVWTASGDYFPTTLAIGGDVLYVGTTDHLVEAFDARGCGSPTCAPVASVQAADGPVAEIYGIAPIAGRVLVGTSTDVRSLGLP